MSATVKTHPLAFRPAGKLGPARRLRLFLRQRQRERSDECRIPGSQEDRPGETRLLDSRWWTGSTLRLGFRRCPPPLIQRFEPRVCASRFPPSNPGLWRWWFTTCAWPFKRQLRPSCTFPTFWRSPCESSTRSVLLRKQFRWAKITSRDFAPTVQNMNFTGEKRWLESSDALIISHLHLSRVTWPVHFRWQLRMFG